MRAFYQSGLAADADVDHYVSAGALQRRRMQRNFQ
jgi:hypothetical protein